MQTINLLLQNIWREKCLLTIAQSSAALATLIAKAYEQCKAIMTRQSA